MSELNAFIDLRSDTVTVPGPAMREAMASAKVGDDVYGEDPTVIELEKTVASIAGKSAGLFVPSGTMGNQIAINLHCRPGESILTEDESHCFLYEAGGAAALSGVQFELIPLECDWDLDAAAGRIRPESVHAATTSLLVVENTHNRCAGKVVAPGKLAAVTDWARQHGLATHCDGARLWNAAAALQLPESALLAGFDSASLCLSKGLGAPVGSVLVGSSDFIARARKVRKRWGGGMRQAGVLAAAALYALKHHRAELQRDHDHAFRLYEVLLPYAEREGVELRFPKPHTNMVYFRHPRLAGERVVAELRERGVLVNHLGNQWVRLVTHRDLSPVAIEEASVALKRALEVK
jgi:threonine aldolase